MRQPFVAGNWKMHGSRADNARLVEAVIAGLSDRGAAECVVCPPAVYLADVGRALQGSRVRLGAQTVCAEPPGAFTGEIAVGMLRDLGCDYVIVGHSERRTLFAETDAQVARKFAAALAGKVTPILCVGEQLAERESGQTEAVIARQLDAVLALSGISAFATAVIAYEPVWAIGTGRTATPEQAQDVHRFIRGRLADHDAKIAGLTRILYGGSVKAGNAADLFDRPDVDGGLIGGASLKAEEFLAIVAAADR
jgi:triosephosphate isomerase (TIM)